MRSPTDWPIRYKLASAWCAVLLAGTVLVSIGYPSYVSRGAAHAHEERARSVSVLMVAGVSAGLEFQDHRFIAQELARLKDVPDAQWAAVWDEAGVVVAQWPEAMAAPRRPRSDLVWEDGSLTVSRWVIGLGRPLGDLAVSFDGQQVADVRARSIGSAAMAAAIFLAVALTLSWWLAAWVVGPLSRLTEELQQVATGTRELEQLDTSVPDDWAHSGDEVRRMSSAMDRMRRTLVDHIEQAQDAEKRAHAASLAKSVFLANMSHELRTPLNAVLGYAELVLEETREEGRENWSRDLSRIGVAGRHLLGLINTILDLSKVEAGHLEIISEVVGLDDLLRDVGHAVHPLVEGSGNTLSVERPRSDLELVSDGARLRQCLINLLGNAAKFTTDGEIRLHVSERAGHLMFAVTDTGAGIEPEVLSQLFEPFMQGGIEIQRTHGGTGLGLALTRRLARLMGGDVLVKSRLGEGSTFTLEIAGTFGCQLRSPLRTQRPRPHGVRR